MSHAFVQRLSSRKAFWKICCLISILAYVSLALRDYVAYGLGTSDKPRALEQAIALDPSNALYHSRLGQYFMFSEDRPDLAASQYESAVILNPHIADYWLDLANAYAVTGATDQQEMALERAHAADPNTPLVSQQVANAFLIRGDLPKAFSMYRQVLETDPEQTATILEICWQATHDVDRMTEALPRKANVYLAFLNLLIGERQTAEAEQAWSRLIALGQPLDPSLVRPYFDYLIAQHDIENAHAAWEGLSGEDPRFRPYLSSPENLVVDGGFEEAILNMGFDWRYVAEPHVVLAVDKEQSHGGTRSVSITFDGEAVTDTGLFQLIPVDTNTRNSLTAYAKTDIFAAYGPQFVISDADTEKPLLVTEGLLGTTGWNRVNGSFETGPHTGLVALKIVRPTGAGRIEGKLWIDDVEMASE